MSSARPRDRDDRGYGDKGHDETRRSASGTGTSKPGRAKLNEFFVDGHGIHREVMQTEICKDLGPEAYSRPSTYNVR